VSPIFILPMPLGETTMEYADTVENAQWFSDARDVALRACTKYQKEIENQAEEIATLKRELVHFRAKAKRLDRENVNHRVDLRMYRKQCLDYDNE
jgi:hypothetical protein